MKKFLSIVTIFGYVIGGLILLSGVFAAPGARQPSSSPAAAQTECDCSHLDALQRELRNALRLQQAFRAKIPELREKGKDSSQSAFEAFTKGEARRGFEETPNYKGPKHVDYYPWGRWHSADPGLSKLPPETLCKMIDSSAKALEEAKEASECAGIGAALQAHENWHINTCVRTGFLAYEEARGDERAQEEVGAYGAQIAVLRAEIAKMLERANVRIEYETNARIQFPPNPMIIAELIENRGVVPMSRAAVSGDLIKLDGEGQQTMTATIEGNCRFTGGLPFTLAARGSIETDGLDAQIRITNEGKGPDLKTECKVPGGGTGHGMSLPVTLKSDNVPVINLPLKNRAEQVLDQSTGEAAKIMAQGGAKLSGQAKIRLILCEK